MEISWFQIRYKLFVSFAIFIVFWAYYAPPTLPFLYLYWQMSKSYFIGKSNPSHSRSWTQWSMPAVPPSQLPSLVGWQPKSLHKVRLHRWDDTERANEVPVSWKKNVSLALCNCIVRPTRDGRINLFSTRGNNRWASVSCLQWHEWTTKGCHERNGIILL